LLGITRPTLYDLLAKYAIEVPEKNSRMTHVLIADLQTGADCADAAGDCSRPGDRRIDRGLLAEERGAVCSATEPGQGEVGAAVIDWKNLVEAELQTRRIARALAGGIAIRRLPDR
jgi:hypothetical protein